MCRHLLSVVNCRRLSPSSMLSSARCARRQSSSLASQNRERPSCRASPSAYRDGPALTVGYVRYMYMERAAQVPRSKVHQKLLQATRAIIGLVRKKEALEEERRWLREEVGRLRGLQVSGERRKRSGTEVVQRSEESSEASERPQPPRGRPSFYT